MGALVTLDLPDDSPMLKLPWIVTFGPIDDDETWEPVVCGPYERAHALSLAETVVADEDLMAVVEPLQPHTSVEAIRGEIEQAKANAEEEEEFDEIVDELEEFDEHDHDEHDHDEDDLEEIEPTPPPSADEVRAGFARIAARLTAGV